MVFFDISKFYAKYTVSFNSKITKITLIIHILMINYCTSRALVICINLLEFIKQFVFQGGGVGSDDLRLRKKIMNNNWLGKVRSGIEGNLVDDWGGYGCLHDRKEWMKKKKGVVKWRIESKVGSTTLLCLFLCGVNSVV